MPTHPGFKIGGPGAMQFAASPPYPPAQNPYMPTPPASEAHPIDWTSWAGSEVMGVSPQAAMRGHPPALSWWMQRSGPKVPTPMQPLPIWLQSRPYDRGAPAFAPKFGVIPISPIGAGIYSPYKLPVIAGPGARYEFAAIWFDTQTIPTSIRMNPTVPVQTINALLATSHVGATYLTTG